MHAALAKSTQDKHLRCASYIWCTLQAHCVMKTFITVNFWGHPLIGPIINLHLFQYRVPTSVHDKSLTRILELEKQITTLKKNHDSLAMKVSKLFWQKWLLTSHAPSTPPPLDSKKLVVKNTNPSTAILSPGHNFSTDNYLAFGVMMGNVPLTAASLNTPPIRVGVYVEGSCWPSWIHLSFSCCITLVWIWSPAWAPITQLLLKGFNHFSYLDLPTATSFQHIGLLLCSGWVPCANHMCWDSEIIMVLCHSLPNNVKMIKSKKWFLSSVPYKHTMLGGVLDLAGTFYLFSQDPFTIHPRWQQGPTRTLKSILSSKIPGKKCFPPKPIPSGQRVVSFLQDGTVHPDGLFPFGSISVTKTVAPFIYSDTRFCCQPLSLDERVSVLDHSPS